MTSPAGGPISRHKHHWFPALAVLLFAAALSPATALADGIGGTIELTYSHGESNTSDPGGFEIRTRDDVFLQRYRLALDRTIYPNLRFSATGLFERVNSSGDLEAGPVS